jgi:hypothetical protein
MNAGDLLRNFYTDMALADDRSKAFQAIAEGVADASGLITIQRIESLNPDLEHYGRLRGFATADQDYVLCLETRGGGTVVLGTLQNTAPSGYSLDAGLTISTGNETITTGNLTVTAGTLAVGSSSTLSGFLRYGGAGAASVAALSGAGTTGATSSVAGGAFMGDFNLIPGGTGIAAGALIQVNFGTTLADANYAAILVPRNANASGVPWYLGTRATTSVAFNSNSALTTGQTYAFSFYVIGR